MGSEGRGAEGRSCEVHEVLQSRGDKVTEPAAESWLLLAAREEALRL